MTGSEKWHTVCIEDICETIIDCVNRTAPKVNYVTPYKMIRTTNVRNGKIDLINVNYVENETYKRWTRRQVPQKGDIILTREAPLGEVGMLRSSDLVFLGQRLVSYRIDPRKADNRFILYTFQDSYLQSQIKALGSGSTVEHMRVPDAKKLMVPLPDLSLQKRIGDILSAYDDLIENNTRRITILEEMARRLYEEWFVHFRFPGHEKVKFKDSDLGRIPKGWSVELVDSVLSVVGGGTPSTKEEAYWDSGKINWYSPTDLTKAGTAFIESSTTKITELGLRKSSAQLFPPYSVMLTSRATIGLVAINTKEACTNQGFITCIPNKRFPVYLLFHWLRGNVETFISLGTGATFKEITKSTFRKIPIIVPSADVSCRFESAVEPFMACVLALQRKNANLRTQRDLLLPKLISGELDVSDAPLPNAEVEAA